MDPRFPFNNVFNPQNIQALPMGSQQEQNDQGAAEFANSPYQFGLQQATSFQMFNNGFDSTNDYIPQSSFLARVPGGQSIEPNEHMVPNNAQNTANCYESFDNSTKNNITEGFTQLPAPQFLSLMYGSQDKYHSSPPPWQYENRDFEDFDTPASTTCEENPFQENLDQHGLPSFLAQEEMNSGHLQFGNWENNQYPWVVQDEQEQQNYQGFQPQGSFSAESENNGGYFENSTMTRSQAELYFADDGNSAIPYNGDFAGQSSTSKVAIDPQTPDDQVKHDPFSPSRLVDNRPGHIFDQEPEMSEHYDELMAILDGPAYDEDSSAEIETPNPNPDFAGAQAEDIDSEDLFSQYSRSQGTNKKSRDTVTSLRRKRANKTRAPRAAPANPGQRALRISTKNPYFSETVRLEGYVPGIPDDAVQIVGLPYPPFITVPALAANANVPGQIPNYKHSRPYYFGDYHPTPITKDDCKINPNHNATSRGRPPVLSDGNQVDHETWHRVFANAVERVNKHLKRHSLTFHEYTELKGQCKDNGLCRWIAIGMLKSAGVLPENFYDKKENH